MPPLHAASATHAGLAALFFSGGAMLLGIGTQIEHSARPLVDSYVGHRNHTAEEHAWSGGVGPATGGDQSWSGDRTGGERASGGGRSGGGARASGGGRPGGGEHAWGGDGGRSAGGGGLTGEHEQGESQEHTWAAQEHKYRMFWDAPIHARWEARDRAAPWKLVGHVAAAFGWFFAVPTVASLAHVLGGVEQPTSSVVTYAFVTAAILTVTEFVSEAGTAQTSAWLKQWDLLQRRLPEDVQPWHEDMLSAGQAFEIAYVLTMSRTLWLYAADDLLLAIGIGVASYLTLTGRAAISKRHAALGLLIATVCVADFGFEVARFQSWQVASRGAFYVTLLIDALLLPIWLLWLGVLLRRIHAQGGAYGRATGTAPARSSVVEMIASDNKVEPSEADPASTV